MSNAYLQRRYLINFDTRRLPHIFTDVLVIGAGAAGLRAAIEAADGAEVIVACKADVHGSNTYYAQGGLAAVMDQADSTESHIRDTLATACGLADESVVRYVVEQAPEHIRQLRDWGLEFDTDDDDLALGREGAHSASRIVHANGDATGQAIVDVLLSKARSMSQIKMFDHCFVIDLLTAESAPDGPARCIGALTYHDKHGLQVIEARSTILAAGGAGMLWRETTNPPTATADSTALAFRAGAVIADPELMQFHPTTLYVAGATRSLISEAVRGEGAHLVDRSGDRFMGQYHPDGELAGRDVVARAILDHMIRTNTTNVYLDVRHIGGEAFTRRFPQIDRQCRDFGIDPGTDLIPVRPAAHYMVGGVQADMDGRTSVDSLLCCGEAASTGLHGANRLASNSLTEALIFGQRCGRMAAGNGQSPAPRRIRHQRPESDRTVLDVADIRNSLRSVMWRNVGIVRRGERLAETREIVAFWGRYVLDKEFFDVSAWEAQNMLTAAYIVAECAFCRTETRGVHYREDFPETDPTWARHQLVRRSEQELIIR